MLDTTTHELAEIPTHDPEAALRFCRALAHLVEGGDLPALPPIAVPHPVISIVAPIFDERENLPVLYERLVGVMDATEPQFEIVLVDDGSRDGSLDIMHGLAARDARVTVVELARNFGHQVAISAGLDYARGDAVIVMDADLQDPPEVLPQFITKWREGHDVVYAIREQRKEGVLKQLAYRLFYRMLQRIANIQIPLDSGDFCIMDRKVVDLLAAMPERNRFVRGIRSWVGLDQVGLGVRAASTLRRAREVHV